MKNNLPNQNQFSPNDIDSTPSSRKRSGNQTRSKKYKRKHFKLLRINPLRNVLAMALIVLLLVLGFFGLDDTPFGDAVRSALDEATESVTATSVESFEETDVLDVRIVENSIYLNDLEILQDDLIEAIGPANGATVYLIDARAKQSTWESVDQALQDAGFVVVPEIE
jgi:hypothetical protein